MKRVLLLIPVLALLAVVIVSATRGDSGGGRSDTGLTADVVPYPRTTKPLPVPQIHVGEAPWTEPLTPGIDRSWLQGGVQPPGCGQEGEFRVCRSG